MLLLSYDSKYLFSVNGSRLNVYSISSGEIVYRLSYANPKKSVLSTDKKENSESLISSICLNPNNKYQLFSFHQSGIVCLWDYEDGLLIKAFDTNLEIRKVLCIDSNLFAIAKLSITNISDTNRKHYSLYKLMLNDLLKNKTNIDHEILATNLDLNEDKFQISIDSSVKYAAFIQNRKMLTIKHLKNVNQPEKTYNAKMELTCLAIHPNEDCIATGTQTGKIILWYNYLDTFKGNLTLKPTMNVLHWHSLRVLSLCFTTEGSYLLSGGHECVLVKWMYKTGQKDFKPRLGAPLSELSCSKDNTIYAIRHIDNTIQLIGSNLNVIQTISSFLCPNFLNRSIKSNKPEQTLYPTGLNYFSRLNCLVSNGKPGHLQFYSYLQDKLLFNLDIVDENYISPENLDRPLYQTEIEHIAFNTENTWMATIERRDDQVTTPEIRLKFWKFDLTLNKFVLNTLVRYPHSFEKVNTIKFIPNENRLVTCGSDGCFKTWNLIDNKPQASSITSATIDSTNTSNANSSSWCYDTCNGFRDLVPNDVDFVKLDDDSLLIAVSFDNILTLWTYSWFNGVEFYDELINCDQNDPIKQIKFIGSDNLLAIHKNYLNLWRRSSSSNDSQVNSLLLNSARATSEFNCIWCKDISKEQVSICSVFANDSNLLSKQNNSQLLLIFSDNSHQQIKVGTFEMENKRVPKLKFIHDFVNSNPNGQMHFVCIGKTTNEQEQQTADSQIFSYKNYTNLIYCDNKGLIEKVNWQENKTIEANENEFLWNNRINLAKNLSKSNLSTILEYNKSLKQLGSSLKMVDENVKQSFEENLKKIESTPAYLLPKVSTFCLDTLYSIFHSKNLNNLQTSKKENTNNQQLISTYDFKQ